MVNSERTIREFIKVCLGIPDPTPEQMIQFRYCKKWMLSKPTIQIYIDQGLTNSEIAIKVGVTVDNVKWHRRKNVKKVVSIEHTTN